MKSIGEQAMRFLTAAACGVFGFGGTAVAADSYTLSAAVDAFACSSA